jgi:hypothetical protein
MDIQKHPNRFGRLLLLILISTIFAEMLSGSISLSRIMFLPGQFLVYGPAVILIREISRRLKAGWFTILLLGLAFGLMLEGLTLQSVFSPLYMGNNLAFGRSMGINWVWTVYMPLFHAFFSISTPILLAEVIFNEETTQPWASNAFLYIVGTILLAMLTLVHIMFIRIDHFNAEPGKLVLLAGVIVVLIVTALKAPYVPQQQRVVSLNRPSYHIWLILLVSLTVSLLWFLGIATVFMSSKPAPGIVLFAAPLILAGFTLMLFHWNMVKIYTLKDRLFMAVGLVIGEMVFGYFVTAKNPVDHYGQVTLIIIILILLGFLYRKLNRNLIKAL